MKKVTTLFFIILIVIILFILLHIVKKNKEKFLDYNLPFPSFNYNNNVSNYQFFRKSLLRPNWNHQPRGWYQWWNQNQSNKHQSKNIKLYKQNNSVKMNLNQLFYDGIWKANNHLSNFCNSWIIRPKDKNNYCN